MATTHPNENTTIIILPSSWKTRAFDPRIEEAARKLIREEVLMKRHEPYFQVRAKIKHSADGTPERIIAYMLRANTYTADIVEITLTKSYGVVQIKEGPEVADTDEDETPGVRGLVAPSDYADFDMVCATCVPEIPTAREAIQNIAALAQGLGLRVKILLGAEATVAAYRSALTSGLRAFVNVGHGYTGGIVLADGNLTYTWFQTLTGNPLSPAVVYFNSCQVFNPPLQPSIMAAGARTFIGGIVNLLIGPSENVCKAFWRKALAESVAMGTALADAERDNYPTTGAHGIGGDLGLFGMIANKVTIYEHNDFRGRSRELGVGRFDLAQIGLPNDSLSSLRVPSGLKVTLYQDAGFSGNSVTFTESAASVGSFNDKTSSIVIETATTKPMVDIYEHADFKGMRKQLGVGRYNLKEMGLPNDCLSSLRVGPGLKVTLYQHANFTGELVSYINDTSFVGSFNDQTSSIVIEPASHRQVQIFEQPNFLGRGMVLGVGSYNLGEFGIGNDTLSSVRVPPGLEVTLYQNANFAGPSMKLRASSSNLGSFADKTSSIRVRPWLIGPVVVPQPTLPVQPLKPTNGQPGAQREMPADAE